ncbi:MAG: SH3 domain-containing protein [Candidatus Limnocylindria bacterium]
MTQRRWVVAALAVILVIGAAAIGYALASSRNPTPSPSPSPSAGPLACEVSVSPDTIVVNPDTGQSDDVLFFAGTGFPPDSAVSIFLTGSVQEGTTSDAGSFTVEVDVGPGVTHPEPQDVKRGPVTWTVTGWDAPQPPGDFGSLPPRACETQVTVTIELTHEPSPTPPTDLAAGGYAEVIADGVRVRVAPSPTATVIGALFSGDVVRILAPAQVAEGFAWYRIETVVIASGQPLTGYVAAGVEGQPFLRPTTEPPPPTPSPSATPPPPT